MKALVTGGGGFLGGAIVRLLRKRGDEVRSFSRSAYPDLLALDVECLQGDLDDREAVGRAVEGCDVVYHVAALAGIWGKRQDYYRANVLGTQNVLSACRQHGVRKLVFTSSPSVVFAGRDQEGIDESEPYPDSFLASYPETKAMSEREVLAANDSELATVALRPHLIWGPGDNHLIPRILDRAAAGKLRLVGGGTKLVDSVYISNAAEAHLLAADNLDTGSAVAGKAYFISQGEPLPVASLINGFLSAAGRPAEQRSVPLAVAHAAGAVLECIHGALGLSAEPRMTRFMARQLGTAHWFDLSAARRDFGYDAKVTIAEGMERVKEWLQTRAPSPDS